MLKPCRGHQNRTFALFSPRPLPLGARREKKQEKWTARGPPTFELCDFGGKRSIGAPPEEQKGGKSGPGKLPGDPPEAQKTCENHAGVIKIAFSLFFFLVVCRWAPEGRKNRKNGQPGAHLILCHRSAFLLTGLKVPWGSSKGQRF